MRAIRVPKSVGTDITKLGFPTSFAGQTAEGSFPRFDLTYFSGFGVGPNANNTAPSHTTEHAHTYFASASFTKIYRSHNFRFGFEGREKQDYSWSRGNASGNYTFNGQYTAGPGINAGPGFGNDLASMMLGLASGGSVDLNAPAGLRGRYYAWFVQDDWKITPTLTLNLGLRYDLESPTYEQHDRIVAGWLWNQSNPIEAAAQANYAKAPDPALAASQFKVPGGDLFAGTNGLPSGVWDWNKGDYRASPRPGVEPRPAESPAIVPRRLGHHLFQLLAFGHRHLAVRLLANHVVRAHRGQWRELHLLAGQSVSERPHPAGGQHAGSADESRAEQRCHHTQATATVQ